jgi:hypothetical protein
MIQFDELGFMKPYNIQNLNLSDFELLFSTNQHRKSLFDEYSIFLDKLNHLKSKTFINGLMGVLLLRKISPEILTL